MPKRGSYWLGCVNSRDAALRHARAHHGAGYRVRIVRDRIDTSPKFARAGLRQYLVQWELEDADAARAEDERRAAPTGAARQAMAYLAEEELW